MNNVALAQRIKDKCKDNNITINQLTEECGLSKGFIYELEKRDKSLSSDRIYRIANYLNCSSDYLLGIELKNNEQEKKLLNLFNQLDEDYKKQAISQVFQLVVKMANEQDEELNSKKAYIAALGGGVMQIDEDLAKYIEENIVVDEYKPNNKF